MTDSRFVCEEQPARKMPSPSRAQHLYARRQADDVTSTNQTRPFLFHFQANKQTEISKQMNETKIDANAEARRPKIARFQTDFSYMSCSSIICIPLLFFSFSALFK